MDGSEVGVLGDDPTNDPADDLAHVHGKALAVAQDHAQDLTHAYSRDLTHAQPTSKPAPIAMADTRSRTKTPLLHAEPIALYQGILLTQPGVS